MKTVNAFRLALLFGTLCQTLSSTARTWDEGIAAMLEDRRSSYRYYLPEGYDESIEYPLVLFLHGSGESGTNNRTQVERHIEGLISKTESEYPAILVAPQLFQSVGWSPHQPIDRTDEILELLVDTLSVDTNRLYLTGLSMGGFGSMEYAQRYNAEGESDLDFAAVAPLSGAFIDTGRPGVPEGLLATPVWLAHGSSDNVVSAETSRNTFRVLAGLNAQDPIPFGPERLGGPTAVVNNVRYTEIVNGGHGIWSPIYNNNELYDWMFAQSLVIPEPGSMTLVVGACWASSARRRRQNPPG